MSFTLKSTAFAEGEAIPTKYSCDGEDISPPLEWEDAPENTRSFALICDDPDAPGMTFVHWVLFNVPDSATSLPEGVKTDRELSDGSRQGTNNFNNIGFGGPCPPGGTHRYFFKLYALDTTLDLEAGISKDDLLSAMEGHILAETQLMGTYAR
jgi:Raf kinase inhibitor-like YbhB/YbcL family protein